MEDDVGCADPRERFATRELADERRREAAPSRMRFEPFSLGAVAHNDQRRVRFVLSDVLDHSVDALGGDEAAHAHGQALPGVARS